MTSSQYVSNSSSAEYGVTFRKFDHDANSKAWAAEGCIEASFNRSNRSREFVEKIVDKIEHLLGDQVKFVRRIDGDSIKFQCILCNVTLGGFFHIEEHIMDEFHRQSLKEFYERELFTSDSYAQTVVNAKASNNRKNSTIEVCVTNVGEAVSYLNRFFSGKLTCNYCSQIIVMNNSQLMKHDETCPFVIENMGSSAEDEFGDFSKNASADQRNSMLKFFENFLISYRETNSNVDAKKNEYHIGVDSSLDVGLAHKMKNFRIETKFFNCLKCCIIDDMEKWEQHVQRFHSERFDTCTVPDVSCTCLLCETLIFGQKSQVAQHVHFKQNANFFSLNHHRCLADVLNPSSTPRYFKFELRIANSWEADVGLGLYCVVCDVHCFQKFEKHITSDEHKLRMDLICDLHFCETCNIIIYGDEPLVEHHRTSWSHIHLKERRGSGQSYARSKENVQHQFLLMSLKLEIEKLLLSQRQPEKELSQSLSFFCTVCTFVTNVENEWHLHLNANDHAQSTSITTEGDRDTENKNKNKPFEFVCAFCRLSLFGTVDTHITHVESAGHKSIKQIVVNCLTDRNIVRLTRSATAAVISVDGGATVNSSGVNESKKESYVKTLNIKNHYDFVVGLKEFLEETLNVCELKSCKNFECWFCKFQAENKNWWTHLQAQMHIDQVNLFYKASKSCKAVAVFCYSCNLLFLGPSFVQNSHRNEVHEKKSVASRPSEVQVAKSRSFTSQSSDNSSKKNDQFEFARPNDKKLRGVFENSALKSTWQQPRVSESEEDVFVDVVDNGVSSPNVNEMALCRSQSVSSNASSTVDDEADDLYMLVNGETDEENRESGGELEDSFSNDAESELISRPVSDSVVRDPGLIATEERNNEMAAADNQNSLEKIKHLIIAKGLPPQVIEKRRFCFNTFSKYGLIRRIFSKKNKPDWLYMLVLTEPEKVFENLNKNIDVLKIKLGTDELSIEYDTRNTDYTGVRKQIAAEIEYLFSNTDELRKAVCSLIGAYNAEINSIESKTKIQKIESSVLSLARMNYGQGVPVKVYTFGSRVTGLATENSDVDIYLQIDNSFGGGVHDNTALQQQLVLLFSKKMKMYHADFKNVVPIPFARVPIVKFTHVKSQLNCDLSFKSGLSTMNSMLVKAYLQLDDRIKYVVCAVKLWMKKNDLADRNLFTTYAQIWMVLFFLMQPDIAVVPTVLALRNRLPPGWNCAFPNIRNVVWRTACTLTGEELLRKFFEFYSNENLQIYVMCTLTGIKLQKKYFLENFESLPASFNQYKFRIKNDRILHLKIISDYEGLCIQDPFDHCHNLTKTINVKKFAAFINLCRQTADIMKDS